MKIYVPDTSAIIDGIVSKMIEAGDIKEGKIFLHKAVLAELEFQANYGREIGFLGLDEMKKLKELSNVNKKIIFEFVGERPKEFEIKYAKSGEIDSMIREEAIKLKGVLITLDKVDAEAGKAQGIEVIFIEKPVVARKLQIESFFDAKTMSVHLKEGVIPYAKKGLPGNWEYIAIGKEIFTKEKIQEIAKEIVEDARMNQSGSFIEAEHKGSTIVQIRNYRIVILKYPLADGWEITAVRPIRKMTLEEYKLPKQLLERVTGRAEGMIIAGPPGMGKSTFAQAVGENYHKQGKVVKTIESPRDLQLPEEVTQLSKSLAGPDELRDILLLTRPDYTIYDEMRSSSDFALYADLRLAGVGMVGVLHASTPIDAIQRFVKRVELGMIPSIVDTVIFIEHGQVAKVYELKMSVKVPSGMTESDLTRPTIEIKDFLSGRLEYEMYTFGEQTVVVPVIKAGHDITEQLRRELGFDAEIKIERGIANVYVEKRMIKKIIGKGGKRIRQLEKRVGMPIQVNVSD